MKRMWSEEEVNAAIAEYAATHPAGGKLYLHKVHAQHAMETDTAFTMNVLSTSQTPFTSAREIPQGLYLAEGSINDNADVVSVFQIYYTISGNDTVIGYTASYGGSVTQGTIVDPIGDIEFTDEVSEL